MKFVVKKSCIRGKGCFAATNIKKGETVCFLRGKEKTVIQLKRLYISGKKRYGDPLQVSPTTYIELDIPFIYFNHSCNPNAGMRGKNCLFALKKIKPGTEITFDYSTTMDDSDYLWGPEYTDWVIKCGCRSRVCRGKIDLFKKIPRRVRHKYFKLGAVQGFIKRKFKND